MKTTLLFALLLTTVPLAQGSTDVSVTFDLSAGSHLAPSFVSCSLSVPAGSNGAQALDAAVAQGCIDSWTPGFGGAYVECINDVCGENVGDANLVGTFWGFYVDEALPCGGACGILDVELRGGERVEFSYLDWYTPFTLGL